MTETTELGIGDLAREFDITTRTIRHYEDIGLLKPQRRGQTRIYSPSDRTRLRLILRGKRLGFSLEESRAIVDLYDPAHGNVEQLQALTGHIQQQREKVTRQLRDINKMIKSLDEAETACRKALKKARKNAPKAGGKKSGKT
ncbi:MerR family transcriptional regulator [Porticoccus sp.]